MNSSDSAGIAALSTSEAELARARAQLQASLGALESRLHELRDWRSWVRQHPLSFAAGAFALGILIGWRGR